MINNSGCILHTAYSLAFVNTNRHIHWEWECNPLAVLMPCSTSALYLFIYVCVCVCVSVCVCVLTEVISAVPSCDKDQFQCANGKCISSTLICNYFNDCEDYGSDEINCKTG